MQWHSPFSQPFFLFVRLLTDHLHVFLKCCLKQRICFTAIELGWGIEKTHRLKNPIWRLTERSHFIHPRDLDPFVYDLRHSPFQNQTVHPVPMFNLASSFFSTAIFSILILFWQWNHTRNAHILILHLLCMNCQVSQLSQSFFYSLCECRVSGLPLFLSRAEQISFAHTYIYSTIHASPSPITTHII